MTDADGAPTSIPGVDLDVVTTWLDGQGIGDGPLSGVSLLTGGTQNILMRFERSGEAYVLRRPPVHKRANSDSTMLREARVLAALADTAVPHPRFVAACSDPDLLGGTFFVMEAVEGFSPVGEQRRAFDGDPAWAEAMSLSFVDAIAALGNVDHVAVGLDDFGKPTGWLARQVGRWRDHLDSYNETPEYDGPHELPGIDAIAGWLSENLPAQSAAGIVHGDAHLANVLIRNDRPEVAALVDWELSTLGDPLLDLGWLLATWPSDEKASVLRVEPTPGLPSLERLIERYGESSGRDVAHAWWYGTMACYKLGIILEGTWVRSKTGKASEEIGFALHQTAVSLFERALNFIDRQESGK